MDFRWWELSYEYKMLRWRYLWFSKEDSLDGIVSAVMNAKNIVANGFKSMFMQSINEN